MVPTHAAGVEPGLLAKTVTSNLRIRSKPGVGDDSAKLEPLLEKGNRFMVLDGPVEADGYDWFLVAPRAYDDDNRVLPTGWVAAGKDGEQWIKPLELDCPSVPTDVDDMKDLASDYQLSCFSGVEITFSARLEQTGYECSSPMPIEPAWFGRCPTEFSLSLVALNSFHRFLGNTWGPDLDLGIAAPPAAPPEMWPTVEVTGQFDHPAATTCEADTAEDTTELAAEVHQARAVLACRNAFVVTSMRVIED